MDTRTLGASDLQVSVVGLGCNNFGRPGSRTADVAGTKAVLDACLEHGVTFLDTADIYGGDPGQSETLMGEALQGRRDRVVLATKFAGGRELPGTEDWGPKTGKTYIRHALDASLRRLQTEHIDLYQVHTPHDDTTPIEVTLEVLDSLVDAGKIRWYGHSNFSPTQASAAADAASDHGYQPFVSAQNNYSLLERGVEAELLPLCRQLDVGFLPYFPLASGLLTGKYTQGHAPEGSRLGSRPEALKDVDWARLERYQGLCEDAGLSMLQVSIGWLLANDAVSSVIAGATTPEQVALNAEAGAVRLEADLVAAVDDLF